MVMAMEGDDMDPTSRLEEAIKQIELARMDIMGDELLTEKPPEQDATLAKAELLVRGVVHKRREGEGESETDE